MSIFTTTRKSVIRPVLYELMRLFLVVHGVSGAISSALGTVSRGAVRKPGDGGARWPTHGTCRQHMSAPQLYSKQPVTKCRVMDLPNYAAARHHLVI